MSEPRRFPFGGVPVYNPQSLSKTEALAQFHARQAAYQSLMDLLREERPSHVLIIGTRGMGKTTLLQRVHYGVEDDAQLNSRYLVLAFPEEQYNVNRLHHFFLNAVDALADALERLGNKRMLARVEAYAESVGKLGSKEIDRQVPDFLAEIVQEMNKNLLLLVDNADRLFDTIESREQWTLRELLSNRPDLTLFGATTQASEGIYGSERAFYEFFKIHRLAPLTFEEVRTLLLQLSESVPEREGEKGTAKRRVTEWLDADASRLRTLVQLTGGNPRTAVLLFNLVLEGLDGGAREYLEHLLDQCTPNYKGRVDELPPQAQQVLDAVALKWDPVTAMEVAEETGLETNVVSTQLTRLVRQGLLEKADAGHTKKALYQVSERFFNIWYLMRASRRVRARLRWFVEFLRVFFNAGELEEMAWERLEHYRIAGRQRPAEIETAFAYVLASGANRDKFEDYLRRELSAMEQEWRPYLDLIDEASDSHLDGATISSASPGSQTDAKRLASFLKEFVTAMLDDPDTERWRNVARLQANRPAFTLLEGSIRREIERNSDSARLWLVLGILLREVSGRARDALLAFRRAAEVEPNTIVYWDLLADTLSEMPGHSEETIAALQTLAGLEPTSAERWARVAAVLSSIPSYREEAVAAVRKAIELRSNIAEYWCLLGLLLSEIPGELENAETALRKAIERDQKNADLWASLGFYLACRKREPERAEPALRKAVELRPDNLRYVRNLGVLLYCETTSVNEAIYFLRKAADIAPWDSVSAAVVVVGANEMDRESSRLSTALEGSQDQRFWHRLVSMCENYPPFGKILAGICDLIQSHNPSNVFAPLHRALAIAQLGDFPRATVALEDALIGDPIELLAKGRTALESFLAAAVRHARTKDCIEVLDRKDWKDAWRPVYEALVAANEGTDEYLKRVAVEIREPAKLILERIAPNLPGLPTMTRR